MPCARADGEQHEQRQPALQRPGIDAVFGSHINAKNSQTSITTSVVARVDPESAAAYATNTMRAAPPAGESAPTQPASP